MSNTPPKVNEFFILIGTAAVSLIVFGLVFKGGLASINATEWLCLGTLAIPLLIIFISYRFLEKYRENKPRKETVQKLGLDD